jgi:hypothetical protein
MNTICAPKSIYQDARKIDSKSFYKPGVFIGHENLLLKVSISYHRVFGKTVGYVNSAYRTDRVKRGEIWLWGHVC